MEGMDNMDKTAEIKDLLTFTTQQIRDLTDPNRVLGDPIVSGEYSVYPVSRLSAGFAGGGAGGQNKGKKDSTAAGAGGKTDVVPMAFLVVGPLGAEVISVNPEEESGDLLGAVIKKAKKLIGKK